MLLRLMAPHNSAAHADAREAPCLINRHRPRAGGRERCTGRSGTTELQEAHEA